MKFLPSALWSLSLLVASLPGRAQRVTGHDDRKLEFAPAAGGRALAAAGGDCRLPGRQDSVRIEVFRCYLSKVRLLRAGRVVYADTAQAHLLDLAEPASLTFSLPGSAAADCDALRFTLGIDSATNAAGAAGGPLDPVNGMYWAWQSGYINLKLEGTSPRCDSRQHRFQYHLGGFREGQLCARDVELPVTGKGPFLIAVELDRLLEAVDLPAAPAVMTPGAAAIRLSERAATMFTVRTTGP